MTKEAILYHRADDDGGTVVCDLCRHRCRICNGRDGLCRTRRNVDGRLVSLVYSRCVTHRPDPIEHKPLLHFLPGSKTLSFCTAGCNFHCPFCQNYKESQCLKDSPSAIFPGGVVTPEHLLEDALQTDCMSISPTWTEPTVFLEYALDAAKLAREKGLAVCFVSNGYMTPETVDLITPWLDAINVDLKSFNSTTYRDVLGGELDGVVDTLKLLHKAGVWVEVSTTFVPGMNDSEEEIYQMAEFLAELSVDIPWHLNCAHPAYQMMDMHHDPLPLARKAIDIGHATGLHHVYTAERFQTDEYRKTVCTHCGEVLVERAWPGYSATATFLNAKGNCPSCGTRCAGVWRLSTTKVDKSMKTEAEPSATGDAGKPCA